MNRPQDWDPVWAGDPIPADSYEVRQLGRDLRNIATEIDRQTKAMKKLVATGSHSWEGEAAREFAHVARRTSGRLEKAHARYAAAASAIEVYVGPLEAQQAVTLKLRAEAQKQEVARNQAQARIDRMDPNSPQYAGYKNDVQIVENYTGILAKLKREIRAAVSEVDRAGRTAAQHLHWVVDNDKVKDGHFEGLKDAWKKFEDAMHALGEQLAKALSDMADVVGQIATVLGVAALLLGWIPGIGQALVVAAIAVSVLSLACETAKMIRGEGDWMSMGLAVLGILSGGMARAASKGLLTASRRTLMASKFTRMTKSVAKRVEPIYTSNRLQVAKAIKGGDLKEAARLADVSEATMRHKVGSTMGGLSRSHGRGTYAEALEAVGASPGRVLKQELADVGAWGKAAKDHFLLDFPKVLDKDAFGAVLKVNQLDHAGRLAGESLTSVHKWLIAGTGLQVAHEGIEMYDLLGK